MTGLDIEGVLAAHTAAGFFYTPDGHAECYCGHVLGAGETYPAHVAAFLRRQIEQAQAEAWDERSEARPQYLGPNNGHYDDCMGWEDCWCASYPNPYRVPSTSEGERS